MRVRTDVSNPHNGISYISRALKAAPYESIATIYNMRSRMEVNISFRCYENIIPRHSPKKPFDYSKFGKNCSHEVKKGKQTYKILFPFWVSGLHRLRPEALPPCTELVKTKPK